MKKLSFINESVFRSTVMHSTGKVIKDEDKFVPDYIDFGENTTVLWCENNYSIDGKNRFTWDEIHDLNLNGWRLPTHEEVEQLDWKHKDLCWMNGRRRIRLGDKILKIEEEATSRGFSCWTCEEHDRFPENIAYYWGVGNTYHFFVDGASKSNKCYVFLVKDKK